MGFFKDFKDDLSEAANGIDGNTADDNEMVNTLDDDIDNVSAILEGKTKDVASQDYDDSEEAVEDTDDEEEDNEDSDDDDDGVTPVDETAVITAGLKVEGNFDGLGSIDIFGTVIGDVRCRGKLTVGGTVKGNSNAGEVFANDAKIEGDILARGAVKIGQNTVIVGNINGTSAVIAGAIKGDIDVRGPVIIDSTAIVSGDIKSKTVQINNGATIDGRCTQSYSVVDMEAIFNI